MAKRPTRKADGPVIVKKYANRRLYDTETSTYITLEDLAQMVREERDFVVQDAKTKKDITHSVLTQIILERETKGEHLLPANFLRQLIRFYGHSMQKFVPGYLELSLGELAKQQEKYREQISSAFAGTPMSMMQEQAKKNMEMFEQAMSMFSPFPQGGTDKANASKASAAGKQCDAKSAASGKTRSAGSRARSDDGDKQEDLADLQKKVDALQAQIDKISG